jgi:3-methyladenine DNA glycosylase AlkD
MLDIAGERRGLLAQFVEHADPAYREGNRRVLRTSLEVIGVRAPALGAIARGWQQAHRDISCEELLGLVEALWSGPSQEERVMALLLLIRFRRCLLRLEWQHVERWRHGVENWGLGDLLATEVFGPWLLADRDTRLAHLDTLIADPNVWSRRLALVATVPLNRAPKARVPPDLTFALVERVKAQRDPMITKAVSWALRELAKTEPARVAAYVEANRSELAAHVVREVGNKLRTGLKSGKEHPVAHA